MYDNLKRKIPNYIYDLWVNSQFTMHNAQCLWFMGYELGVMDSTSSANNDKQQKKERLSQPLLPIKIMV